MSKEYTELLNRNLIRALHEGKLQLEEGQDEQRLKNATNKMYEKTRRSFVKSCIATAVLNYLYLSRMKNLLAFRVPVLVLAPFLMTTAVCKKEFLDYEAQKMIVAYKYEKHLIHLYPELMEKRTHYANLPAVAQPALHQLRAAEKENGIHQVSSSYNNTSYQDFQDASTYQPIFSSSNSASSVTVANPAHSSFPSQSQSPAFTSSLNQIPTSPESTQTQESAYSIISPWDPYGYYNHNNIYIRFT